MTAPPDADELTVRIYAFIDKEGADPKATFYVNREGRIRTALDVIDDATKWPPVT